LNDAQTPRSAVAAADLADGESVSKSLPGRATRRDSLLPDINAFIALMRGTSPRFTGTALADIFDRPTTPDVANGPTRGAQSFTESGEFAPAQQPER